jgi:hypothetical protein
LHFHFWQEVLYENPDDSTSFPSKKRQCLGRFVGIAEQTGDNLTFLVMDSETGQVIPRHNVRPANDSTYPHQKAQSSKPDGASPAKAPILTPARYYDWSGSTDERHPDNVLRPLQADDKPPAFSLDQLKGITFLIDEEDGQTLRGKVLSIITDKDGVPRCITQIGEGDGAYQELMEYHDLCDMIERQRTAEAKGEAVMTAFAKIIGHKYVRGTKEYKGSAYNVLVLWCDGTKTWEPLGILKKDDPYSLAEYAIENGLMGHDGWKSLQRFAKNRKKLTRMLKRIRKQDAKHATMYKYGVEVPYSYRRAIQIDKEMGTTFWHDSMRLELDDMVGYDTFTNLGRVKDGARAPPGYQRVRVHFVYDIKADGRY